MRYADLVNKMYKSLTSNLLILFSSIVLYSDFAYGHRKFDTKNKENIEEFKITSNSADNAISIPPKNDVYDNLIRSFDNYPSFEESMGPENQFKNLFRNTDRELKKSVFRLWETYEKEMSKQVGDERLNGPDINNTINESLNSLSK